ncbi:fasciclin-1-like [Ruditapes philippinarum]|uniref:fasciclin-1-like n=1 Tax=Ruditapes philippinarum TaxID=129788 RepID=UPI00295BB6B7|nr:fasciclin-1-like [Ruditapes philippinarum]
MADTKYLRRMLVLIAVFGVCSAQVSRVTILDVMTNTNGLKTFASWCRETFPGLYSGSGVLTVFAFNDTAYTYTMPSSERTRLMSLTLNEKREYVQTFTLDNRRISVDQLRDSSTQQSINGKELFINKRNRINGNPGSTTWSSASYVNGAMIIGEQLQASNGIIHMLDRPLSPISDSNVYQWLMEPDDPTIPTTIWRDFAARLYQDSRVYLDVITPIARTDKITFFLPSENALRKIPSSKIQGLQGQELAKYFKMHYIKNRVVYTSYVEHQESYETALTGSRVMFMRQDAGTVLVKCGGVTAMIEQGNITVRNGVIHIIDRMFGLV